MLYIIRIKVLYQISFIECKINNVKENHKKINKLKK